jgi:hypothetical protein
MAQPVETEGVAVVEAVPRSRARLVDEGFPMAGRGALRAHSAIVKGPTTVPRGYGATEVHPERLPVSNPSEKLALTR